VPGPLDGIRVVELADDLAGQFCTMLLGDQGADVVKVEHPEAGGHARGADGPSISGESIGFLAVNRNKLSVTLDPRRTSDLEALHRLVAVADVLVTSRSPVETQRWGLGWERLSAVNPRLVLCSITGRGEDGPQARLSSNATLAEAQGGLMSVTGMADGPPVTIGVPLIENLTGLFAKDAITAALLSRSTTNRGQKIETSLLESTVAILGMPAAAYLLSGLVAGRWGTEHQWHVPWKSFETADGHVVVASSSEDQWRKICLAVGRPDLADDERFTTMTARAANRQELYEILDAIFLERPTERWLATLSEVGAAAAPVNTIDQVFADAQVLARDLSLSIRHPTLGELPQVGHAQKFSATPASIRLPPPVIGEHQAVVPDAQSAAPQS